MLLAIETSSRFGSVALVGADGVVQVHRPLASPKDHAQGLAPTVQALLPNGLAALDGYAISLGPGSFTGLRIGVAFLKGIAAVVPRPAWGVSSLEVLAAQGPTEGPTLAVIDARRGNVFAGLYGPDLAPDPRLPDGMYGVDEIRTRFGTDPDFGWVGDGVGLIDPAGPRASDEDAVPRAHTLALRAVVARQRRPGDDAQRIAPVYHQRSAAEEAKGIWAVPDTPEGHTAV